MRRLGIAALTLVLTALAAPAAAFVAEVTTSISMEDIRDEAQLRDALQKTVDSVLSDAIAFRPTVVLLTHALVMRGRLYVRLLVADQEGERAPSRTSISSASQSRPRSSSSPRSRGATGRATP